jgi:Lon protease-like protein
MPLNRPYKSIAELPATIAVFPLSGVLLLPRAELPLNIFEPRYVAMIDDAMRADRLIGMVQPTPASDPRDPTPAIESVGGLGRVTQIAESGDGRYVLSLTGVARFRVVKEEEVATPYRQCRVDWFEFASDLAPDPGAVTVDRAALTAALRGYAEKRGLRIEWRGVEATPVETLVNMFAMMSPFEPNEKQALLEADDIAARAAKLIEIAGAGGSSRVLH